MSNKKRAMKASKTPALSPRAIQVAAAFDALPQVAQNHVVEIINSLVRVRRESDPITRLLWNRADPKRVRMHERRIERYQSADRVKRRS